MLNRTIAKMPGKFTPISLDKISERIQADDIGKHDLKLTGREFEFTKDGTLKLIGDGGSSEYKLSDWAFGQLCTKIGVPSTYLRKCPVVGKGSQKDQIDLWKETIADKNLLLRVKNVKDAKLKDGKPVAGFVRAILTQSYSALDNGPLWRVLRPFLEKNELLVQSANMTDQSLHVRALYPDLLRIPTPSDKEGIHMAGLHTCNSEIGARYLTGDFMIYRQICTNGLVAQFHGESLFKQKHSKVDLTQLRMQIASALQGVHHHKIEMYEILNEARTQKLKSPEKMIEGLLKREKQPQEVVDTALANYKREPLGTMFGVAQALTATAKTLNVDKRLDLETLAGKWLLKRLSKDLVQETEAEVEA